MSEPTIPAGTYPARAVDAQLGQSTQKGTEYIGVTFEIRDPELEGEQIEWQGWLSEKALPYTVQALQNAGWKGDDIENCMRDGLGSVDCELMIEWEEYRNKYRAKVKFVNKPATPLDGKKKDSIRDRVRAAVKHGAAKEPARPDPEDDVNF